MTHQSLRAVSGQLVGMSAEQSREFGFNRLSRQRSRAIAQNFGQQIGKELQAGKLQNARVGDGVSLLVWEK